MSQNYNLSIVIVSYNTRQLLRDCLASVYENLEGLHTQVLVVDNASSDSSAEMVQKEFPHVQLFANKINVGYAKANNQALRRCTGDFILLLNSDTKIGPGVLTKTMAYLHKNPAVGILTCKVLLPNGQLDLACRRSFPTPWVAFCRLMGLSSLFPKNRLFAKYNLTYLDENETYEVEAVMGAFMLMPREAFLEVGVLDESFFMYGEDLDWCYRFRQSGYKIMYYPEVSIWHFKGASSLKRRPPRMIRVFHEAWVIFYRKYFAKNKFFLMNWIIGIGIWFHYVFSLLASRFATVFFKDQNDLPVQTEST